MNIEIRKIISVITRVIDFALAAIAPAKESGIEKQARHVREHDERESFYHEFSHKN